MAKNIIKFTILLGLLFCSCQKEMSDKNSVAAKVRLPLNEEIIFETRDPVLLELFPENSLSPEDREALLLLLKWSDLGQSLDYPERIKLIAIQYNEKITDKDLQFLERFPNLEELFLKNSSKITDKGMSILKKLPHLKILSVPGTQVTEASLPLIAKLKNLRRLYLSVALPANYRDNPEGFLWGDMPPQFSDTSMYLLKNSELEALYFSSPTSITCDGLQLITSMKNLKTLSIRTNKISLKDIKQMETISFPPKFESLDIYQDGPPERKSISKFRIKNVRIFLWTVTESDTTQYNNLGAEKIRLPLTLSTRDPELLEFFPENSLSPEDREALLLLMKWSDLGESLDYPERIKLIVIRSNEEITDMDLQFLERFPNLEGLFLNNALKITDEGMSILKKLPRLESLNVSGTQVTEASLPLIAKLKNLRNLYLGVALPEDYHDNTEGSPWEDRPPQFSDTSIDLLKNSNLESLLFTSPTSITCDGLQLIASMKNLKKLSVRTNKISFKDIKHVKAIPFSPQFESLVIFQEGQLEGRRLSIFRIKNVKILLF
jgi:hypothetical protein